MASRRQDRGQKRPATRLYLVTQGLDDAGTAARALEMTLGAGDIAAILLRLPRRDEESLVKYVKQAAPLVQNRGTALVLDGHPELVGRTGADGAHLTGYNALKDALRTLKPERIAGAGGLYSR